ncbi:hypothetical protein MHU86_11204 [Fragilaria crotonensis]|nr:hypothetical protein MHU86_11204 [Fragilaria crotonensis]
MTDSGGINSIIAKAVVLLHTDSLYGPRISNCWLPAATWAEVLAKSGHIDPALVSIDARKFNTAMSKSVLFGESMTRFDGTNQSGMFRLSYGRQFFYHFAGKKKQVVYPVPLNNAWKEKVLAAAENVHCIPATRARPRASSSATSSTPDTTGGDNVGVHDTDELDSQGSDRDKKILPLMVSPCPPRIGQAVLRRITCSGHEATRGRVLLLLQRPHRRR